MLKLDTKRQLAGEYRCCETYNAGDEIIRNGDKLVCRESNISGTFDITKWTKKGSNFHFDIVNSACANLDGRFHYIDTNQKFQSVFQNDFYIECIIQLTDGQAAASQTIFGSNVGATNHVQLYVTTAGVLGARYIDNAGADVHARTASAVFANGESDETLIKAIFTEANGIKLYVDGTEQTLDGSYPGTPGTVDFSTYTNTTINTYIGARNNNGTITEYFGGKIANLLIMNNTTKELQVQYPLAEGHGLKLHDVSGNEYHATANLEGIWWKWVLNSTPTAVATTEVSSPAYQAENAFDTDLTIDGASSGNAWAGTAATNQRLVIDFGSGTYIKDIRVSNYIDSGSDADWGVKSTKIYVSDDATDYTGTHGTYTATTEIWDGIIPKHESADSKEFFIIDLDNYEESGRYLIFEFADNWGDASNMGIRRIEINSVCSRQDVVHYNSSYGFNRNVGTFNGTSNYINTNQSFQTTFRNDFVFEAVIWPDDGQPAANQYIFGTVNSDDSDEFSVFLDTSGDINATFTANANTATAIGGITLANGALERPVDIKVVCDSTTLQVFVNGVEGTAVSTSGITFSEYTSSDNPYIGAQNDNGSDVSYFDGKIWNVIVYDNTNSEVANYPIADGSGTAIIDLQGTNGTANSSLWGNASFLKRSKIPFLFDYTNDVYGSANPSNPYVFDNNHSESCFRRKDGIFNEFIINGINDLNYTVDGTKYIINDGSYKINTDITLDKPLTKLKDSNNTKIYGTNGYTITNGTSEAMIQIPYLSGVLEFLSITISSPSAAVFDISNDEQGGNLILDDVFFIYCNSMGTLTGITFVLRFSRIIYFSQGFVLDDNNAISISDIAMNRGLNASNCIFFNISGECDRAIFNNNFLATNGSNESVYYFDSGIITNDIKVSNDVVNISSGGSVFASSSLDQSDPYITFSNVTNVKDSTASAMISIGTNAQETSIPVANAIVLINSNQWSSSNLERFTVDANGVTEYTGIDEITISITQPIAMDVASGTNKDVLNQSIKIESNTSYEVTFTNGTNTINETGTALSNGDTISFYNTAGTLPAELRTDVIYYVVNKATDSFQVSYTSGGAAIAFTDDGSGTNSYSNASLIGLSAKATVDSGSQLNLTSVALTSIKTGDEITAVVINESDTTNIIAIGGGYRIIKV